MLEIAKIREKVEQLLSRNKISKPAVPVERIAKSLKLTVRKAPLDSDLSGALVRSDGEAYIGVNSRHHPNRQRFTIAHELGHFVLHNGMKLHVDDDFRVNWRDGDSSRAVSPEEMEANRFAAELLMPTQLIVKDIEELESVTDAAVRSLARRYKVSPYAMRIRLANFGFIMPQSRTSGL